MVVLLAARTLAGGHVGGRERHNGTTYAYGSTEAADFVVCMAWQMLWDEGLSNSATEGNCSLHERMRRTVHQRCTNWKLVGL